MRQGQRHAPLQQVEHVQREVVAAQVLPAAAVGDVDVDREVLRLEGQVDLDQRDVGRAPAEVHGGEVDLDLPSPTFMSLNSCSMYLRRAVDLPNRSNSG